MQITKYPDDKDIKLLNKYHSMQYSHQLIQKSKKIKKKYNETVLIRRKKEKLYFYFGLIFVGLFIFFQ